MSIFLIILTFLLLVIFYYTNRKKHRLPPGPLGLPIVGYLPWLNPKAPHQTLTQLTRKYGPICGLKMGSVYTVLLSDPRLIRQVLAKGTFSGRAPLYLTHGIMRGYGLICAEGELWKDQRKFVAGCLKNLGMVKFGLKRDKMEGRILAVVNECISKLKDRSTEDGFDPNETLHHCVGNLMNDLVFGKTYDEDDRVWTWLRKLQEEGVKHIGVAGPLNFLPFLRFLPQYGKTMYNLIDGKVQTHQIYQKIIDEHRSNPVNNDSILSAFNDEMTNRMMESNNLGYFTEQQYYHLLADIFGAGTDTTLTTLRWFLLFVAAYPQEQEKIRREMQQVLSDKEPTLEDRIILTRLEATIAEVQRLRSVVPVGIPHGTIEDTQIGEYDIPKGTMIVPLQWSIHTNPSYWKDPLDFKPDRFIADDGSLAKPEAFLPFQTGKRSCVGDELAKMILFLFSARILHRFVISIPPNVSSIDFEGECGITLIPKPHRLVFTLRENLTN
ncbi:cytochrome P450 306a1 [Polistes fuscatus]|uniref:cytochrome P450 306a1 n=1 Tax=Polistes fuscatus TaxID=30207 RepID=UPI001CA8A1EB|nr:cytochrome P450 306a1 [Polistes fuscatus]XP_043499325.1 cytochrome P450 306a1 [Polistes fuscatus]XP_043499326.1 cytochrome P450 306a1 [Polistes fuscatus]